MWPRSSCLLLSLLHSLTHLPALGMASPLQLEKKITCSCICTPFSSKFNFMYQINFQAHKRATFSSYAITLCFSFSGAIVCCVVYSYDAVKYCCLYNDVVTFHVYVYIPITLCTFPFLHPPVTFLKLQRAKSPTSSQQSLQIPLSSVLASTFDPWPPTTPSPASVSVCLFCGSYSSLSGSSCSSCCWLCCWLESGAVLEDLMERHSDSGQLVLLYTKYIATFRK